MPRLSLGTKFLAITVGTAIIPMSVVGIWLAAGATRTGEERLKTDLDESLRGVAAGIGERWASDRSSLLNLADHATIQMLLRSEDDPTPGQDLELARASAPVRAVVTNLTVRRIDGREVWHSPDATPEQTGTIRTSFGIFSRHGNEPLGRLEAQIPIGRLVPVTAGWTAGLGSLLGVVDRATATSLLALPFDPDLARSGEFTWNGETWLASSRLLEEPAVELFAAAPLDRHVASFAVATSRGLTALLFVTIFAALATVVLTRRTSRSLARLAQAATAVAQGDLSRAVAVTGDDEVSQVGRAFNAMTDSLRRTLDALAHQESLAAVGKFAAGLAHEVRNPLTSIRIDLQRLQEQLDGDTSARDPLERALRSVVRLDATVTGALRVARSGQVERALVSLTGPLEAAIAEVREALRQKGVMLRYLDETCGGAVLGDGPALQQVFLNLLLNALHAVERGGAIEINACCDGKTAVVIAIDDSGHGVPESLRSRVFEDFVSTRSEGTGLGLTISRRIAEDHGGTLTLAESPLGGARFVVTLPSSGTSAS